MSVFIPYIYIVGTTVFLCIALNRKIDSILPLSVIMLTFFATVFSLFGALRIGIIAYALSTVFVAFVRLMKEQYRIRDLIELIITPGFAFFTLMFIFIGYYHRYTDFTQWDEWSHWGQMVRDMYNTNTLFNISESYIGAHKEYPSFVPVFETIYCVLSGSFKESYIYRGISILSVVFFTPVFEKWDLNGINFKKIFCFVLSILSFVLINLCAFYYGESIQSFFTTIYTDSFLSIIAAYTLFLVLTIDFNSRVDLICLSVSLSALLMTKQMSLAFIAIDYFVLIFRIIIQKNKISIIKILLFFAPFVCYFSYSFFIKYFNLAGQFNLSDINFKILYDLFLRGIGADYRLNGIALFKEYILSKPMVYSPINLSYFVINALIIVVLYFILKENRKISIITSIAYFIGTIGYALTMLVLYMFSFSEYEVSRLASFFRYMQTYVLFGLFLILMIMISKKYSEKTLPVLLLALITVVSLSYPNLKRLEPASKYNSYKDIYENREMFNQFDKYLNKGDKVLIIQQYISTYLDLQICYLYPEIEYKIICLGSIEETSNNGALDISDQEWIDLYMDYDYVYTYSVNDDFIKRYWNTTQTEYMLCNRLYYVDNGKLTLMPWISGER